MDQNDYKWQQSYGLTKLELLGIVTSIFDCVSYLHGHHFIVECNYWASKSLFQKQLKGAIYEYWLAILQQFDIHIIYKSAPEMTVADSFYRKPNYPEPLDLSAEEDDVFFPFVT